MRALIRDHDRLGRHGAFPLAQALDSNAAQATTVS